MKDVRGIDEEVRTHVPGRLDQLGAVLLEFGLLVAPGEVRVGLGESDAPEGVHHRRPGEGLGQEEHVGIGALDVGDELFPERHRLGVRVVHPEDAHPVGHPVPHHPQDLGVEAFVVPVEVDRVDVLVLLRRVLRVGDGTVALDREPLGVGSSPTDGRARTAAPGRARPPCRAGASPRRRRRNLRGCRDQDVSASWPPKREPIAQGLPGSLGPGSSVLFGPLRLTSPMGEIGGR